ncbi:helix-turn-helix domain-containing protein [Lactobacillus amylovorus]|uniref:helix-turn-helix domain-containing protein n=1 Tax=Lactobacillus amylovorus TaxID=1604 RepID=UPI00201E5B76|nr:helix-turn-helix transcriptional regulator [Lactobacillus amylovorus]
MKEFNRKILANNIKELRKQKKLNQIELAKQLNVSQQTIGAWETGRAIPGSDTLDTLANYFNVTTDYLLGRDIDQEPDHNDDTAVTWSDLGTPMPYGGKIPDELKDTYADLAKSYFKRHPEYLNKD